MRKLFWGLLLIVCTVQCGQDKKEQVSTEANQPDPSTIQPVRAAFDAFGIDVGNFNVHDFLVQKNESLYLLLDKFNFDPGQIYTITQRAKNIIDFRSFKPGQHYRAYASKDSTGGLEKLVWQPNAVDFVVFDWQDSLQIYKASKVVTQKVKRGSGKITSSLYNAVVDEGLSPALVSKMSDIFAWQIDFFHLQKGDHFKILYENEYVDGKYYRTGDIQAIQFSHMGDTYWAYHFHKGDFDGYYDEKGKSVKKALLKTPFKYDQRISSSFNMHRFHPILHRYKAHTGIDYAAPYGTHVMAVGDGIVLEAHYGGAAGRIIKIKHNRTFTTAYMHLSRYAKGIHKGVHVKQGEVIGYVGHSGRVTGTHLHYSVYKNGRAVNPAKIKLPPSKSIPKKYAADFKDAMERFNASLFKKDTTLAVNSPGKVETQ